MHYKTNRQNHDFQIAYFLAGSCHTPDGAWSLLCDLKEDRKNALSVCEASKLREQAKILRAKRLIASEDEADQLEGRADLSEIEAMAETVENNIAAAQDELAFIEKAMAVLEPLRRYAHLSPREAHQAAQFEEWKLELIHRAENNLLMTGTIPVDQFATMRMHPAFKTEILPAIEAIRLAAKPGTALLTVMESLKPRAFELPALELSQHLNPKSAPIAVQ